MLEEVREAEGGVEALEAEVPFAQAEPLPPRVHPLAVQNVVWSEKEARCEEPEESLVAPLILPEACRAPRSGEGLEVLPEGVGVEQVALEGCAVLRPDEVLQEGSRRVLSFSRVFGQQPGCEPRRPHGVLANEGQMRSSLVTDDAVELQGILEVVHDALLVWPEHFVHHKFHPRLGSRFQSRDALLGVAPAGEHLLGQGGVGDDLCGRLEELLP